MKVFGKLIKKFPVQTGETKNGAQWVKQNILLEQDNQYNKEVVISFFGDEKVQKLQDVEIGEEMISNRYEILTVKSDVSVESDCKDLISITSTLYDSGIPDSKFSSPLTIVS